MGRGEKVHFGGTSKYYPICTKLCLDMSEMQWNTGNMQPESFHNNYIYHGDVDHPNARPYDTKFNAVPCSVHELEPTTFSGIVAFGDVRRTLVPSLLTWPQHGFWLLKHYEWCLEAWPCSSRRRVGHSHWPLNEVEPCKRTSVLFVTKSLRLIPTLITLGHKLTFWVRLLTCVLLFMAHLASLANTNCYCLACWVKITEM